jgi:K+-sensing histidine kinase KdpD
LLANAARHSDAGTTTTLTIYQEEGQAVLQVRDEGCGIAAETLTASGRTFLSRRGRPRASQNGHDNAAAVGLAICRRMLCTCGISKSAARWKRYGRYGDLPMKLSQSFVTSNHFTYFPAQEMQERSTL